MNNQRLSISFSGTENKGGNLTQIAIYLDVLGWSPRHLSDYLDINERGVWRWMNGQNETPENVLEWLRLLVEFHQQNAYPQGWTT